MWNSRRAFVTGGLAALGASALHIRLRADAPAAVLKPRRLRDGDRIALVNPVPVAPAASDVESAQRALEAAGLTVLRSRNVRPGTPPVSDEERAREINEWFADDGIRGIVALRGGWGCAGLLPHLDYDLIAQHPKVLLGFSDVDALLLGIHARTGLVTFHGPTGLAPWAPATLAQLRRLLFDADRPPMAAVDGETVMPGQAQGRLLGGNLTVVSSLVGSPYLSIADDVVLFLEEVSEPFSEVDRMLTQLRLAGLVDRATAVVFGGCEWCGPPALDRTLTLNRVLSDQLGDRGFPVFLGAPFGHVAAQLTVPLGITAHVDATRRLVRLLEPAVL